MCNRNADTVTIDCFFWCGQSALADTAERIPESLPERFSPFAGGRRVALSDEMEGRVVLPLCASDGQECALKKVMANRWNC
ncbi:MAG: hypothetical protein HZA04_07695 [Nitrospinae bacterium]|nr:hypothetical protein [Nitrospinota bacterium]